MAGEIRGSGVGHRSGVVGQAEPFGLAHIEPWWAARGGGCDQQILLVQTATDLTAQFESEVLCDAEIDAETGFLEVFVGERKDRGQPRKVPLPGPVLGGDRCK